MKRTTAPALVTLALLACTEPTSPARSDTYPFDLSGDVFHWPADRLPVRFFAAPAGNLRFLVERAIGVWTSQFLYGEFTGRLVDDSSRADVIVRWTDSVPPDVLPDSGPPVFACNGVTSLPAVDSGNRFQGPLHVEIGVTAANPPFTAGQVAACTRRTVVHELGHTLGILRESPDTGDIMHSPPRVASPSERDRNTVAVLYHTPPTILPPP